MTPEAIGTTEPALYPLPGATLSPSLEETLQGIQATLQVLVTCMAEVLEAQHVRTRMPVRTHGEHETAAKDRARQKGKADDEAAEPAAAAAARVPRAVDVEVDEAAAAVSLSTVQQQRIARVRSTIARAKQEREAPAAVLLSVREVPFALQPF
jgi:hypothetical protein